MTGTAGTGAGGQINTQTDGKNCGSVGHDCPKIFKLAK
jgi:hypothetical protein